MSGHPLHRHWEKRWCYLQVVDTHDEINKAQQLRMHKVSRWPANIIHRNGQMRTCTNLSGHPLLDDRRNVIHICTHTHIYVYVYVCIYVYIYVNREREREGERYIDGYS